MDFFPYCNHKEKVIKCNELVEFDGDKMGCLWKMIKGLLLLTVILFLGVGLYLGNVAVKELWETSWDEAFGIPNQRNNLRAIHNAEARNGYREIHVISKDGTKLVGTFVDGNAPHKYVILLHGIYQNRSMLLPYARVYREMGYHIIMADLRGHGESGGNHTDWGVHDIDDMNAWTEWIQERDPQAEIGIHGISLGAAMALIYSGSEEGQKLKFIIADSSYGNLLELSKSKILRYTGDERFIVGMNLLNPFFQAALYYHTGKLLRDLDPLSTVEKMKSPVLFLHGKSDSLIPYPIAEELSEASGSRIKKVVLFENAEHTMELSTNREEYERQVRNFVSNL